MQLIDHEHIALAIDEKPSSQTSRSNNKNEINASEPSPPRMPENKYLRDLASNPLLKDDHPEATK